MFIHFSDKNLFTTYTENFSEWPIVKCKHLLHQRTKTSVHIERRRQTACRNWATPVWYSSILESRSIEPISVTCFCLSVTTACSEFIFHKTVPTDINIPQGNAATPLRCSGIINDILLQIIYWLLCVIVKEFCENLSIFGEVTDQSSMSCFLIHSVHVASARWM